MDGPWWSFVLFLPVFVVLLAMLLGPLWATVDAAVIPSLYWRRAGHNKALWLVLIWCTSGIAALYYVLKLRPRLRHLRNADR